MHEHVGIKDAPYAENDRSSRAHTVLVLQLTQRRRGAYLIRSRLNLVDLVEGHSIHPPTAVKPQLDADSTLSHDQCLADRPYTPPHLRSVLVHNQASHHQCLTV